MTIPTVHLPVQVSNIDYIVFGQNRLFLI